MKLYFVDCRGNTIEKSFTDVSDAMTEVYRAAMLGWFVYDEYYNPITPIILTDDCIGKFAVLMDGERHTIRRKKDGYLSYNIDGYNYDSFGQGRYNPSKLDSILPEYHVAYVED